MLHIFEVKKKFIILDYIVFFLNVHILNTSETKWAVYSNSFYGKSGHVVILYRKTGNEKVQGHFTTNILSGRTSVSVTHLNSSANFIYRKLVFTTFFFSLPINKNTMFILNTSVNLIRVMKIS